MRIQSIALGICVCALSLSSVHAATLIVTTTADSGAGSLRDAIAAATAGDTIQFDPALNGQTITLTTAELLIDRDLTISGPGAEQLTVMRSTETGTPEFRIFEITPAHTVTIEGLTISNGLAQVPSPGNAGGGIYNNGSALTIANTTINSNSARFGGGIFNDGRAFFAQLTISNCTLSGNLGTGTQAGGGGIWNRSAQLTISNCTLSGNLATGAGGFGGGIFNYGSGDSDYSSVVMDNSTISGSSATYGAGIYNDGYYLGHAFLIITNSTISGNSASQQGGAIYNDGRFLCMDALVQIQNSTISGNSADVGGAIANDGEQGDASLRIEMSTFSDNSAAVGSGIYNHTVSMGTGAGYSSVHSGGTANPDGNPPPGAVLEISNTILKAGTSGKNIHNEGLVFSAGYNLSNDDGSGVLTATGDQINTDPMLGSLQDNGGPTLTHELLFGSPAIDAGVPSFIPPPDNDQRGPGFPRVLGGRIDIGSLEVQTGASALASLLNISTRLPVLTDDNRLIGGFIVTGSEPKRVIVRAIGPSLTKFGVPGALADPVLELHGPSPFITITNENWRDTQEVEIEATGIVPREDLESAIVATLPPGAYTAVVRGNNGGTGIGSVEAYDLDSAADAQLANISTRGFVDTGENVMIGGFILGNGIMNTSVLIRAIGPSLTAFGVPGALADPTLELHNSSGTTIAANDDWRDTQEVEIEATGIAPTDDRESAILQALAPGAYTAIVRGKNNTTGVALVEAYQLGSASETSDKNRQATAAAKAGF